MGRDQPRQSKFRTVRPFAYCGGAAAEPGKAGLTRFRIVDILNLCSLKMGERLGYGGPDLRNIARSGFLFAPGLPLVR